MSITVYQGIVPGREYFLNVNGLTIQRQSVKFARSLNISFLEAGGSHDEVLAALFYSFGQFPRSHIQLFQRNSRFKMHDIMKAFDLKNHFPHVRKPADFLSWDNLKHSWPDIVISTSCDYDMRKMENNMTFLLNRYHTYLFCVIHKPDRFGVKQNHLEKVLSGWIQKGRVDFLTLSPHTKDYMIQHILNNWTVVKLEKHRPRVRYFIPIFPIQLLPVSRHESLGIALQGNFDGRRRGYQMVFNELTKLLYPHGLTRKLKIHNTDEIVGDQPSSSVTHHNNDHQALPNVSQSAQSMIKSPTAILLNGNRAESKKSNDDIVKKNYRIGRYNITLHLVGHGKRPIVPISVRNNVVFHEHLTYRAFYILLSRQLALLPAFASSKYLDRAASSTIPASLIAGVPLVATQKILNSYKYLKKEFVWFQEENETSFDVIEKVLRMSYETRKGKTLLVRDRAKRIIEENTKLVRKWIEEALVRVGIQLDYT